MDDLTFRQRALANPFDDSPEFLAALQGKPERQALLAETQALDNRLQHLFSQVQAPEALRSKLLDPALLEASQAANSEDQPKVRNGIWYKMVGLAASLVLALGLTLSFWSSEMQAQANAELTQEILGHLYAELDFLEVDTNVPLVAVNSVLQTTMVGGTLMLNPETSRIKFTVADDCWIAKKISMHMVMRGDKGRVTVLLIPNSPVDDEVPFSDERFKGIISPTNRGNVVVLTEKQEPGLNRYVDMIASNMSWDL